MIIATWNINSVRSRLEHLLEWLQAFGPDVVLLQEIKCQNEQFPSEPIEDLGYNIALHGQKSYNGVAILSKYPIEDVVRELPGKGDDGSSRYIEAVTNQVRVASVYCPNGQDLGTEKFIYKMNFFDRLRDHLQNLLRYEEKVVIGGDYNVAPTDDDVYDKVKFRNRILASPEERDKYRALTNLGYTDIVRALNPTDHVNSKTLFTWWDYRQGSWDQNNGLRIDHLLLSPQAADVAEKCGIDKGPRSKPKPSDHTPVWCNIQ
jgi:exodeoxyribonuclease-3